MAYDVAVVGSGFSAIAVTINLLRLLPSSARIAVVGDDPGFGRGTAYRTEFYLHRLNVPAGRMSVFPDEPDDFVAWLRAENRLVDTHDFASRGITGVICAIGWLHCCATDQTVRVSISSRRKRGPASSVRPQA